MLPDVDLSLFGRGKLRCFCRDCKGRVSSCQNVECSRHWLLSGGHNAGKKDLASSCYQLLGSLKGNEVAPASSTFALKHHALIDWEVKLHFLLLAIDQCSVPWYPVHAKDGIKLSHRYNHKVCWQHAMLNDNMDASHTHVRVAPAGVNTTKSCPSSPIVKPILYTKVLARNVCVLPESNNTNASFEWMDKKCTYDDGDALHYLINCGSVHPSILLWSHSLNAIIYQIFKLPTSSLCSGTMSTTAKPACL